MEKLPKRITENGIDYVLAGDYYIPALRLTEESALSGAGDGCTKPIWKKPAPPSI